MLDESTGSSTWEGVVWLHFSEHSNGFELGVRAVAVVAEFDTWPGGFAGCGYAFDVEFWVESDLDFERLEAKGDRTFDLVGDLIRRFGSHPVARFDTVSVFSSDEVVDGLAGGFADDVPEGLVDGSGDV